MYTYVPHLKICKNLLLEVYVSVHKPPKTSVHIEQKFITLYFPISNGTVIHIPSYTSFNCSVSYSRNINDPFRSPQGLKFVIYH